MYLNKLTSRDLCPAKRTCSYWITVQYVTGSDMHDINTFEGKESDIF